MSAWVVSPAHIDALVQGAITHGIPFNGLPVTPENATEVGRALYAENYRSVAYRYPDDTPDELPGPNVKTFPPAYVFRGEIGFPPGALDKIVACYDYQTCECPDFHTTPEFRFVKDFHAYLDECKAVNPTEFNRQYDRAPWGVD